VFKLSLNAIIISAIVIACSSFCVYLRHSGYKKGVNDTNLKYQKALQIQAQKDELRFEQLEAYATNLEQEKQKVVTKIETEVKTQIKYKDKIIYEAIDNSIISDFFIKLYNASTDATKLQDTTITPNSGDLQHGIKAIDFINTARENNAQALICYQNFIELRNLYHNLETKNENKSNR
jgi:hypothetical protein